MVCYVKTILQNNNNYHLHKNMYYQKKLDPDVILKIFYINIEEFVPLDQKTYITYLGILIGSDVT